MLTCSCQKQVTDLFSTGTISRRQIQTVLPLLSFKFIFATFLFLDLEIVNGNPWMNGLSQSSLVIKQLQPLSQAIEIPHTEICYNSAIYCSLIR